MRICQSEMSHVFGNTYKEEDGEVSPNIISILPSVTKLLLVRGEVGLGELPPDPLLPGDGVHGDAGVARALHVLRVGQPQQDLAHALLRQRVDQSCSGIMFQFCRI